MTRDTISTGAAVGQTPALLNWGIRASRSIQERSAGCFIVKARLSGLFAPSNLFAYAERDELCLGLKGRLTSRLDGLRTRQEAELLIALCGEQLRKRYPSIEFEVKEIHATAGRDWRASLEETLYENHLLLEELRVRLARPRRRA